MMFFQLPAPPQPRHSADLSYLRSLIFSVLPTLEFDIEEGCGGELDIDSQKENICIVSDISGNSEKAEEICVLCPPESLSAAEESSNDSMATKCKFSTSAGRSTKNSSQNVSAGRTETSSTPTLSLFANEQCGSDVIDKQDTEPHRSAIRPAEMQNQIMSSLAFSSHAVSKRCEPSGQNTPTLLDLELFDDEAQSPLSKSPIPIQIDDRPFPDSPALYNVGHPIDSDSDCMTRALAFKDNDQEDINNQLDDALDTIHAAENDTSSPSQPGNLEFIKQIEKALSSFSQTEGNLQASILPSFHPLAFQNHSEMDGNAHSELDSVSLQPERTASWKQLPLKQSLNLRDQFQSLQRLTILEINREFIDERLQFVSQLQSIREKSILLDVFAHQVVNYASSFQKILEVAYNQLNLLEELSANSKNNPTPTDSAISFSVNVFWSEVQRYASVENQHWVELLAKFRSVCVVPLCVDIQEIESSITALFLEADTLDSLIQQAATAHANSSQNFQQVIHKKSLICQKVSASKIHVPGRSGKLQAIQDSQNPSNEFEIEILAAEIQRIAAEEQLRDYADIWKNRMPLIIIECIELNKKRVTTLHAAVIALLDFKNSIFSDKLSNVTQLQTIALQQLNLDEDLDLVNDTIFNIRESSRSNLSASRKHSVYVEETGALISEEASVIIRNYYLSNDRPRSFVIDMWGVEGFRKTYDYLHASKNVLTQVYNVLEGIAQAFESSSKLMRKIISSHQSSSAKYFNNEPIQQSWLFLLDAFMAESDANRSTAKFLMRAVAVLDVIRCEGKPLSSTFNRYQSQNEKQISSITQQTNHARDRKCNKTSLYVLSKDNLNRHLDFATGPDQKEFQPIVDNFLFRYKESLFADIEYQKSLRHRTHVLLKNEVVIAVSLRYAEDCITRHYAKTKKILQGIYSHVQAQNESSQRCLQQMEHAVQAIDTENDLRDFIFSMEGKLSIQERGSEDDVSSAKQEINSAEFDSFHSKSWKGIGSLRFLITLFQEASTVDDGFVRILRKFPWDFSSLGQSLKYSSLVGAFIQLQKTIECMSNCIDERSSRMKEIAKSLKRQKSIIKTNITDIVQQHQASHKRALGVEANFNNISATYRKAVEYMDKISQRNEKEQERQKATHDRRQSFIVTMIQGRLPAKSPRQRMDSAVEVAERTQRALDHATVALRDALSSYTALRKSHIQSLQNINTTRVNAVKWAFTTHCEHQTFYSQQMTDYLSSFSLSIDRISVESDLHNFVLSHGSSAQPPPDRVILSTLDPGCFSRLDSDPSGMESGSYGDTNTTLSVRESTLFDQTFAESDISVDSSCNE